MNARTWQTDTDDRRAVLAALPTQGRELLGIVAERAGVNLTVAWAEMNILQLDGRAAISTDGKGRTWVTRCGLQREAERACG